MQHPLLQTQRILQRTANGRIVWCRAEVAAGGSHGNGTPTRKNLISPCRSFWEFEFSKCRHSEPMVQAYYRFMHNLVITRLIRLLYAAAKPFINIGRADSEYCSLCSYQLYSEFQLKHGTAYVSRFYSRIKHLLVRLVENRNPL